MDREHVDGEVKADGRETAQAADDDGQREKDAGLGIQPATDESNQGRRVRHSSHSRAALHMTAASPT
jgi:hypothetical protein